MDRSGKNELNWTGMNLMGQNSPNCIGWTKVDERDQMDGNELNQIDRSEQNGPKWT